ncbi:hypothetical protein GGX14DRAFT_393425 [Mycena pura]|uniref:Uncharacterized protein n=1 Tax=Mycena pura TaxID=153505 RepID=A0AAD6VHV9_9AGAR|nr:hypothetical protein GGX14DRAFT_393425 [Mycena pura]
MNNERLFLGIIPVQITCTLQFKFKIPSSWAQAVIMTSLSRMNAYSRNNSHANKMTEAFTETETQQSFALLVHGRHAIDRNIRRTRKQAKVWSMTHLNPGTGTYHRADVFKMGQDAATCNIEGRTGSKFVAKIPHRPPPAVVEVKPKEIAAQRMIHICRKKSDVVLIIYGGGDKGSEKNDVETEELEVFCGAYSSIAGGSTPVFFGGPDGLVSNDNFPTTAIQVLSVAASGASQWHICSGATVQSALSDIAPTARSSGKKKEAAVYDERPGSDLVHRATHRLLQTAREKISACSSRRGPSATRSTRPYNITLIQGAYPRIVEEAKDLVILKVVEVAPAPQDGGRQDAAPPPPPTS